MLNESLLKSSHSDQTYDPFLTPPDLLRAHDHRRATSVGKDIISEAGEEACPCCQNIINKAQFALNCEDEELLFLGVGYPLFYKLARYFGLIIFVIFVVSGGGFYFLVTLNCKRNCVYFFGVPIINLEMSAEDSAQATDVVNAVTAFMIFGCVLYIKSKIRADVASLESKFVSPDQYSVILQNLPDNITEEDLTQWCKQVLRQKPVLVNFAYNVTELANAYKNRQHYTIKLRKLQIENEELVSARRNVPIETETEIKELKEKIGATDNLINMYREQKVACHKIGTAFVSFSEKKTVRQILDKYESSLIKAFLNKLLSPFKTPPLYLRGENVIVNEAPGPREVIWQNLSYSFLRSVIAQLLFVLIMILLLFFSFRLQYRIVEMAYKVRHESERTREAIVLVEALAMSLVVVIVNALLRLLIKLFAYFKKYYSYSSYHSSFCFYYSISYIFNTCFMIYIVHGHERTPGSELDQENILIYDIHLIMLANAFSQPLFKVLDPELWLRVFRRMYVSRLPPHRNPYTQSYANQLWEGLDIQIADNYQYIYRMLVVTTWFAHSAPLGVVLSLLGMFVDYWLGKYLLLRHYKKPETISRRIADPMIMTMEFLPLVYICGVLQFTYKVSSSENIFTFMYQFLRYGITIVVLVICLLGYLVIYRPVQPPVQELRHQDLQSSFEHNYQTENPITKFKGQIKYLYGVLKKGTSSAEEKIIRQLLTLNMKSKDSYAERQSFITKLRRKNLKRLDTMGASQEYTARKNSTSSDTEN